MSFPLLLMLLSLVIIIPIFFVIKQNAGKHQLSITQQHQMYLASHAKATLHADNPELEVADNLSAFINDTRLPTSFRHLVESIRKYYIELSSASLAPDERFTVDKLVGVRLSEILEDYLTLDADYATSVIIDTSSGLTSQAVTFEQLNSILDFLIRMFDNSQAQVSSNILANRSYLKSVYGEFYGTDTDTDKVTKASIFEDPMSKEPISEALTPDEPVFDEIDAELQASDELLLNLGEAYLNDCDQLLPAPSTSVLLSEYKEVIGPLIIMKLGSLVYLVENILLTTETYLSDQVSLQAFDRIMSLSLPNLLRLSIQQQILVQAQHESQADMATPKDALHLTNEQRALITQKISRINELLASCVEDLARIGDKHHLDAPIDSEILEAVEKTIAHKNAEAEHLLRSGYFNLNT